MIPQLLLSGYRAPALLELLFNGTNGSTTFTDTSGYNRTVTGTGGLALSTAQFKSSPSSVLMDGSDDILTISSINMPTAPTDEFTFECWIRMNNIVGSGHMGIATMMRNTGLATSGPWSLEIDEDPGPSGKMIYLTLRFNDNTTASAYGNITTFTTGVWYHIAFVKQGNNYKVYVNGTQEISLTSSKTLSTSPDGLVLGRPYTNPTNYYAGCYMDDVRVLPYAKYLANFTPV